MCIKKVPKTMANFTEFFLELKNTPFTQDNLDSLCDPARELLPPMLRVWEVLAKLAVQSWNSEFREVMVANGLMTARDFANGNHAKMFVNHLMSVSWGEYVCDPRYQGMLLGVVAIFPNDYYSNGYLIEHMRKITDSLFLEVDDQRIDWVISDGICNQDWEFVQNIASQWLRAWCSARKIQRAYRKYREYRENQIRTRLRIVIPRMVVLLRGCM